MWAGGEREGWGGTGCRVQRGHAHICLFQWRRLEDERLDLAQVVGHALQDHLDRGARSQDDGDGGSKRKVHHRDVDAAVDSRNWISSRLVCFRVNQAMGLPPLALWTEGPRPASHPMSEEAVEEGDGDGEGGDPPEHPLVHARVVARPELDPEDDHAEQEEDVQLEDAGKELEVDNGTGDVAVVEDGEDREENGGGDAVGDLVGAGEQEEKELADVAALVAVLLVEEVEERAEQVAEHEAAEDGRQDQALEDCRRFPVQIPDPIKNLHQSDLAQRQE